MKQSFKKTLVTVASLSIFTTHLAVDAGSDVQEAFQQLKSHVDVFHSTIF